MAEERYKQQLWLKSASDFVKVTSEVEATVLHDHLAGIPTKSDRQPGLPLALPGAIQMNSYNVKFFKRFYLFI